MSGNGRDGFGPVKSASSMRRVSIGRVTRDVLAAHRRQYPGTGSALVWSVAGAPVTAAQATQAWVRAIANMPDMRKRSGWHDLRHFNASALIAAGISVRAVADRLGHANPTITLQTYGGDRAETSKPCRGLGLSLSPKQRHP